MYDGFISYSHGADRPLAKALQRGLHRIGRPWFKPRALRVFRDDVSLAASPDLWSSIQDALLASRIFTLLACPESAASPWVGREVRLWREKKSRDTFLIVLTGGELVWDDTTGDFDWERTTALPRDLAGWFHAEPLWVDLRAPERRVGNEFRSAAATIGAAIHGVAKDELISEDLRQQRRLISVLTGLLTLALVAGGVAVWQQRVAVSQRDRATEQARIALSRALSGEALRLMRADPQLAIRLALSSFSAKDTVQARAALMGTLDQARHVVSVVSPGTDTVSRYRPADQGTFADVALNADGSVLAHNYAGGKFSLWDSKSRTPLSAKLPSEVFDLTVSADGRLVAGSEGQIVKVWNAKDGSVLREVPFVGSPERVTLSPDNRWLAASGNSAGGATSKLGVWNVETGQPVINIERRNAPGGPLEFSGSKLYTADSRSRDAKVAVFDPATGDWSSLPVGATDYLNSLAVAQSSVVLLTGTNLELWDLKSGTRTHSTDVGKNPCCVSASADGQRIAVGTSDGRVLLFDQNLAPLTVLFHHAAMVSDLSMSADGRLVASIAENGAVVLTSPDQDGRLRVQLRGAPDVGGLGVSASGTAATSHPSGVVLRDLSTLAEKSTFASFTGDVHISPDGLRVALGAEAAVTTWDAATGAQLGSIFTDDVGFLSDSRRLVTAWPDGRPVVEDSSAHHGSEEIGKHLIRQRVATNHRGDTVAILSISKQVTENLNGTDITLWRWNGKELEKIRQSYFAARVDHFTLSEDGEQIAATDSDGRLLFDSGRSAEPVVFGRGSNSSETQVAFTPGQLAQMNPWTGELVLWHIDDGTQIGRWQQPGAAGPMAGLAATGGGGLLSARKDGLLAHWETDPAAWARTLCPMVAGDLSDGEKRRYLGDINVAWPCG